MIRQIMFGNISNVLHRIFKLDMKKDTIITEINSVVLNKDNKDKTKNIKVQELTMNGENYIQKYGGHIDIGLYDTMEDLMINLIGATVFSVMGYAYLTGKGKSASKFMIKRSD